MENPKRNRILEQTRKEFLEAGYSGFTMDEIASKTGISKATIYKYFPGKHHLLKGLVVQIIEEDDAIHRNVLETPRDFMSSLRELLAISRKRMHLFPKHILRDLEKNAPDILELIQESRDRRVPELVSHLLVRGQNEKKIRSDIRTDLIAHALLTLLQEFSRPDVMDRFEIQYHQIPEFLLSFSLQGILTRTGQKELAALRQS